MKIALELEKKKPYSSKRSLMIFGLDHPWSKVFRVPNGGSLLLRAFDKGEHLGWNPMVLVLKQSVNGKDISNTIQTHPDIWQDIICELDWVDMFSHVSRFGLISMILLIWYFLEYIQSRIICWQAGLPCHASWRWWWLWSSSGAGRKPTQPVPGGEDFGVLCYYNASLFRIVTIEWL